MISLTQITIRKIRQNISFSNENFEKESPRGPEFNSWHSQCSILPSFIDSALLREWTVQSLKLILPI